MKDKQKNKHVVESYTFLYGKEEAGYYYVFNDHSVYFSPASSASKRIRDRLHELKLDRNITDGRSLRQISGILKEQYLIEGTRGMEYRRGMLSLKRSRHTEKSFSVYRRDARKGDPDYSELAFSADHYEGSGTPEGMKEWVSWYQFNRMNDGTYEAELDEAWWWGGGHNDGGTMHRDIPEEWFFLPYDDFLEKVVSLAKAKYYGFTAEMLAEREGLKEFFGYANGTPRKLTMYEPKFEDLWFRHKMLSDEETMSYNHSWGGTIEFPEQDWKDWHDYWIINDEGKRFYRYLVNENGDFVGEIAYHHDSEIDSHIADVIILARHRGKGYGSVGLDMLCQAAKENGIKVLYDDIAIDNPAIKMFLKHGFAEERRTDKQIYLKKDLTEE